MNYIYTCPVCQHEHNIAVATAKGTVVEFDPIPESCDGCGRLFDVDQIEEDINETARDYYEEQRSR